MTHFAIIDFFQNCQQSKNVSPKNYCEKYYTNRFRCSFHKKKQKNKFANDLKKKKLQFRRKIQNVPSLIGERSKWLASFKQEKTKEKWSHHSDVGIREFAIVFFLNLNEICVGKYNVAFQWYQLVISMQAIQPLRLFYF